MMEKKSLLDQMDREGLLGLAKSRNIPVSATDSEEAIRDTIKNWEKKRGSKGLRPVLKKEDPMTRMAMALENIMDTMGKLESRISEIEGNDEKKG